MSGFEASFLNEAGVIPGNDAALVTVTNTRQPIGIETNFFTLRKVVEGNFERNEDTYPFTVSLQNLLPEQTYFLSDGSSYLSDSQGRAVVELSLADGEEVSFMELPVDTVYRITEAEGDYISSCW